jgi:hypothetical protein
LIGCAKNINRKSFPSAPPMMCKTNNKNDKEKMLNRKRNFKTRTLIISSKQKANSIKFKIIQIIKKYLNTLLGIFLDFKSR